MKKITLDSQQIAIQEILQNLSKNLESQANEGFLKKILNQQTQLKSFYIHGGVGRGKTMLMRNFFNSLKKTKKIYFHFNAFMRKIHENLRDIRKEEKKHKDELIEALKRIIKDNKVLCFDEFQVLDIADAMILERIFSYLFKQKIIVIFTSNAKPMDLYLNGLQREIFLEFVKNTLLKNCEILYLNSPTDYRLEYRKSITKKYFINNKKNRQTIKEIISNLTNKKRLKSKKLKVWGRDVIIKKTCEKIAVINFDDLCRVNFAASDYQTICQNFNLIFLLKLPKLEALDVNEAKRFMLFIDEVYENKVALIISAKTKIEKIYESGVGVAAFKRTTSRLKEIGAGGYGV